MDAMKKSNKRIARRLFRNEQFFGWLFISPMMIGYLLFLFIPIVAAFVMSFSSYSLIHPSSFIGADNYKKVLTHDPLFWKVVLNTLYFTIILVPCNMALSLGLALLLNQRLKGMGFFRTMIFTPVVTSIVVWAIVWKYIFATDYGLVNQILGLFHIPNIAWLYNFDLAMPVVVLSSLLKNAGLNMVIFLAALQDVPKIYYEAAKIDGASRSRMFFKVTMPMISPSLFLALVLTLIASLKVFTTIQVLTDGGPGTSTYVFVYYIYQQAFKIFEFGYASAIAFILFALVLILTLLQWNLRKRWVYHEQ